MNKDCIKLLDFMYSQRLPLLIWWIHIERNTIEIFIEKNLDLKYLFEIHIFLSNKKYYFEEIKKEKEILSNFKIPNNKWYIYIIKSWNYYKIWKTKDIRKRSKKYITENPWKIEMIHSYEVDDYTIEENRLHKKFKEKNHNREWFLLDENDILYLKNL